MQPIENVCITGGAKGADFLFAQQATEKGHRVIHKSFDGHKPKMVEGNEVENIKDIEFLDNQIFRVNRFLNRGLTGMSEYSRNLLRRNIEISLAVTSLYAVTYLDEKGMIPGGSAWATYHKMDDGAFVYVFDQNTDKWFASDVFMDLKEIDYPPKPFDFYAGIGSRDLTDSGRNAIINLYKE